MVIRIAEPLREDATAVGGRPASDPLEIPLSRSWTTGPTDLGDPSELVAASRTRPRRRLARMLAALAVPAVVAIAFLPGVRQELEHRAPYRVSLRSPDVPPAPTAGRPSELPAPSPAVGEVRPAPVAASDAKPASTWPEPVQRQDERADYSPAFASTGSATFQNVDADADGRLVRAGSQANGAVLRITRIVNDAARNYHVRPSPDGTRIAFDSDRAGVRGVYLADSDGTNVRRVSGAGFAAVPSWSPDGRMLAYVRADADRAHVWNVWTLDLASGAERQLTSLRSGQPWGASWFPDGRRLAFGHDDRLVVLEIESGRSRTYPAPRAGRLVRTPAVSPDGRRIVFQVERDGAWLLDLADGSMRKVLADPSAEDYTWSPDGRRVAYRSRRSGEWGVWLMARE
jgi:hypothetical protein